MNCPQCGADAWDDQVRCTKCGSQLSAADRPNDDIGPTVRNADALPKKNVKCINCGAYNFEGAVYCGQCGLLTNVPKECPGCHGPIAYSDRYCTTCGKLVRPGKLTRSSARPLAALLLGLIPGLLSVWGMGHLVTGRSGGKWLIFFLLGIIMTFVAPVAVLFLAQDIGDLALWSILGVIVWVALWLFQSIDAYWDAGGE